MIRPGGMNRRVFEVVENTIVAASFRYGLLGGIFHRIVRIGCCIVERAALLFCYHYLVVSIGCVSCVASSSFCAPDISEFPLIIDAVYESGPIEV